MLFRSRDGRSRSHSIASASALSDRLVYDSPAKNLRAADATAAELSNLTGSDRDRQQFRVNELIRVANQKNEQLWAKTGAGGSQVRSARDAAARSVGHAASSPKPRDRKSTRLNSSHITRSRMPSSAAPTRPRCATIVTTASTAPTRSPRSEERRVGKECRL